MGADSTGTAKRHCLVNERCHHHTALTVGRVVLGTVGHDLVIAPMPEGLRNETFYDEEEGTADDEMFLDEDDFYTTTAASSSSSLSSSSVTVQRSKKMKKSKNPKKYQPGMSEKKQKLKKSSKSSSKETKSVHFVYKRNPLGSHDAHSDFCKLFVNWLAGCTDTRGLHSYV